MEFFCHHRDRRGSMALRRELLEEHRSYMDRHAAAMVAQPARAHHRYAEIEVHDWTFGGRPS